MMAGSQKSWQWKAGTLTKNMGMMDKKFKRSMTALTEYYGTKIEGAARRDAPWQDQTANARTGLSTVVEHSTDFTTHTIVLFHRVPYGIWLEVARDGKYRIIIPTINEQGKLLMQTLNGLIERL